ncbi:hypothetical protein HN51_008425 [Arachis hypogaea]|uniref:Uncharacterized protein n=2 Tax=Arachis TaxID=3817 RepID=A0A445D3F5_ARAHY|nr:uncharacterized protein LOC107490060 isoform X1 [Arachis duranensis]XP_025700694.1 uncharacterized protein LOC112801950 isoform X1 [Arachis hypogaea]QHO42746.1 uncharacterized protein DS421_5g156880 [Arachis hypogaea]RYR57756.1 hypothetical protein Ahy_A05g023461 [Arachis hypogaea]
MMGHASKFVQIFRLCPISRFNQHLFFTTTTSYKCSKLKLDIVKTQLALKLKNTLQQPGKPFFHSHSFNLNVPANFLRKSNRFSGSYLSIGSILGVSIASASVIAHAMDAGDALVDDPSDNSQDVSEEEEIVHHFLKFTRKFWLPVLFFLTVLTNLDDPIMILFVKVTLFLLSTKPNPFSVYIFVDQLCEQSMRQDTRFFKKKPYASKVEVHDYKLLCLAAVEVRDQKFTLVGILGTWWSLPHLPTWEAISLVKNRVGSIFVKPTENYHYHTQLPELC